MFLYRSFLEKNSIFRGNSEKMFGADWTIFREKRRLAPKNERNLFISN